jgi:hypothetical protein
MLTVSDFMNVMQAALHVAERCEVCVRHLFFKKTEEATAPEAGLADEDRGVALSVERVHERR